MAQYGRPITPDISTGAWTTTPLWSKLDEASFDDADFAQLNNSGSSSFEVKLSSVNDPNIHTGHIVRIRVKKTGSGTITETGYLYQGTTLIATITITLTTSYVTTVYTLTAGEAAAITDYSDLRVRVTGVAAASGRYAYVSWIEFEMPDVALNNYVLQCAAGSFGLSGNNAYMLAGRQLMASPGAFAETGQNAVMLYDRKLLASSGSFNLVGYDAILTYVGGLTDYILQAAPGVFALTGNDARLLDNRKLTAQPGAFTVTRNDARLLAMHKMLASSGSFILVGYNAILTYSGGENQIPIILLEGLFIGLLKGLDKKVNRP